MPLPTTPCMAGVSVGVPSVAAPSGVASTHGAAFPAMAVPNPTTPLGAFSSSFASWAATTQAMSTSREKKSPLPKLVIKSGDATTITRIVHEWLQKTAMALNTWLSSAIQLWHHAAVGVAKSAHAQWTLMVPSQRALQTGLPSTGNSLPPQLSVLEATMRADLINQCLPDRVQSLAIQKSATTVADLLYITFQTFLPSEPSARVDGLADIEAPVRPSRTFAEALSFLRSWRQKIMTMVNDLGGNPEPLKLFGSLRNLISSLVAGDAAFAAEINSIYKQTNVKVICSDESFLKTMDMIEIELSSRSHEDEEEKRKQKNANVAIASFTQSQKGSGKSKPICRDFLTDNGCNKGGQCTFQHPQTVGRCLRCGSTKHSVADCRRPRKDSAQPASSSTNKKGKGRGRGPPLPKPKEGAKGGQKRRGTQTQRGSGGVGAKKFDMSLETREIKLFWRDIPGVCWDIPAVPEKFEKKVCVQYLAPRKEEEDQKHQVRTPQPREKHRPDNHPTREASSSPRPNQSQRLQHKALKLAWLSMSGPSMRFTTHLPRNLSRKFLLPGVCRLTTLHTHAP